MVNIKEQFHYMKVYGQVFLKLMIQIGPYPNIVIIYLINQNYKLLKIMVNLNPLIKWINNSQIRKISFLMLLKRQKKNKEKDLKSTN